MKKILLTAALLTLTAGTSFAGIATTKHNLSSTNVNATQLHSSNQSQICIFCHTPHNAIQSVPLWNRSGASAASAYRLYTSSKSLTTTTNNAKLYADSQSLFCLSCHDGTKDQLASRVQNQGGVTINMTGGAADWNNSGAANLGTNLTNDHPVGFSYGQAYTDEGGAAGGLHSAVNAQTSLTGGVTKTVFFKSAGASDNLECSSCHAVHDDTYSPFLRTTNSGSKLCLACHNK